MSSPIEVVRTILAEHCGVDDVVTESSRFQEDLGLDSMGLLTLALETENHFELCLDEPPDQPPETVGDLVALVEQRLRELHGSS